MSKSLQNLPAKLLQYRLAAGMTQVDLAAKTKQHVTAISHWESGLRVPTLKNLIKLSEHLKVTIDWLIS